MVRPFEVAVAKLCRHVFEGLERIGAGACVGQGILVEVGRVDLDPGPERSVSECLGEHHRERVGLLPGRASRAPDPDRLGVGVGVGVAEDLRHDLCGEVVPRLRVAEERRDVDQNRVEQDLELLGVNLEIVAILGDAGQMQLVEPLLHSPSERWTLVAGEVEPARRVEIVEQEFELWVGRCRGHDAEAPPNERDQRGCNVAQRKDEVHVAGGDGCAGHAEELARCLVLRDDGTAHLLHRLHPHARIGAGPGEYHRDRVVFVAARHRLEQQVADGRTKCTSSDCDNVNVPSLFTSRC